MGEKRIEARPGLEIFVNKGGNISIKQIDREGEDLVVVHPDDVPRLIELLRQAQEEALNFEVLEEAEET